MKVSESYFEAYVDDMRNALTPEACRALDQKYPEYPVGGFGTDPRLFDASLYVIEHSTYPECYNGVTAENGPVWYLGNFVNARFKRQSTRWEKLGDALKKVAERGVYIAASDLECMGPPYQQMAYDSFFIPQLEKLVNTHSVTPSEQGRAITLIEHFFFRFHNPPEPKRVDCFYQPVKRKPPVVLFRLLNQRFQLTDFWRDYVNRWHGADQERERKIFLEFDRIVNEHSTQQEK